MRDRDITVLMKMVQYASEINETIVRFDLDFEKFTNDFVVKNAISMCILQIGELANNLTGEFKSVYIDMPWRDIVNMRHRAVHTYDNMDIKIIWKTATDRIPELKEYCEKIIKEKEEGFSCQKNL